MKTKKLLSFVLAIVMVFSMMAGLSVTASALIMYVKEMGVGETIELTTTDEHLSKEAVINTIDPDTVQLDEDCADYFTLEDFYEKDGCVCFLLKAIKLSDATVFPSVSFKRYNGEFWMDASAASAVKINYICLDLETSTTDILEKKTLDQNYNLTVNEANGANVTKVKLTWEINDINAVRMDNKVWDTTELKWVVASSNTTVMDKGTAKFTLENYSSVKVDATVTFDTAEYAAGKKFTDPTLTYNEGSNTAGTDDGKITLDTAAEDDTYSKTNVPTGEINVTVTPVADDFNDFKSISSTTSATKYGFYTVTIEDHQDEECLAAGTKITMADGSLKNIEDIHVGEKVLTFNHETGEYEAEAVDLAYAGEGEDYGTELTFSDGTTLTIVGEHDLFQKESMKYVTLTRVNANANIGKQYYNAETGKFVALTGVKTTAPVKYYSLYTAHNFNCIANGMLSVPDDVDYMLNIYEFNADLTANDTELQKDIAAYGIYEYRADAPYSKAEYDMMNMKYVNIVIGKGLATFEDLFGVRDEYLEQK